MYRRLCKKKGKWGTWAQRKQHIHNLCSMQEPARSLVHPQCPINMMQANPNTYICTRNHYVRYSFKNKALTQEKIKITSSITNQTHPPGISRVITLKTAFFLHRDDNTPKTNKWLHQKIKTKANCAYKYMIISVKFLDLPTPNSRKRILQAIHEVVYNLTWKILF